MNNIEVYGYCSGCKLCKIVCPSNAISIIKDKQGRFYRDINDDCIKCEKCNDVCPHIFRTNYFDDKDNLGPFIDVKYGHSMDTSVRLNSTSGGVATTLIKYILSKGLIDAAVLVDHDKNNPTKIIRKVCYSAEDVAACQGSKYGPVNDEDEALISVLASTKYTNIAVVGLPCLIDTIQYLINYNYINKNIIKIGLVCNHTPNSEAILYFLESQNVNPENIKKIIYRTGRHPGNMILEINDSETRVLNMKACWDIIGGPIFYPDYCNRCMNVLNHNSDVVLGDTWIKNIGNGTDGETMIITRTILGKKLIRELEDNKYIETHPLENIDIIISNESTLFFRQKMRSAGFKNYIILLFYNINNVIIKMIWSKMQYKCPKGLIIINHKVHGFIINFGTKII